MTRCGRTRAVGSQTLLNIWTTWGTNMPRPRSHLLPIKSECLGVGGGSQAAVVVKDLQVTLMHPKLWETLG